MTLTLSPIHYFLIESILILGSILGFCYLKRLHFFIIAIIEWGGYLVARFTTTNHYSTQIGFVPPPNQEFQNLTIDTIKETTNNTVIDYHPLPHSYHLVITGIFLVLYPLIIYFLSTPSILYSHYIRQSLTYPDFWITLLILYPIYGWFQMYLFQSYATLRYLLYLHPNSGLFDSWWNVLVIIINATLFSSIHLGDRTLMILTFGMGCYYTIYTLDQRSILLLGPLHSYFATGYYYWICNKRVLHDL